jgi:flagellar assembly factor FliW
MRFAEVIDAQAPAVKTENIIHLPQGLLGLEGITKYVLLANPEEAPFLWFQVLEDPNLAFLVLSPFEVLPSYQADISEEDVRFLALREPQDALVYNIVTLRGGGRATINLKGPVVINRHTLIGKQVVLVNAADYALQHPLPTLA